MLYTQSKFIVLPCGCKCCMFVVEKMRWDDGAIAYSISLKDSRFDHKYTTLWGRIKRAAGILFGKPVCFAEAFLDGEERYSELVRDMAELEKATFPQEAEQ